MKQVQFFRHHLTILEFWIKKYIIIHFMFVLYHFIPPIPNFIPALFSTFFRKNWPNAAPLKCVPMSKSMSECRSNFVLAVCITIFEFCSDSFSVGIYFKEQFWVVTTFEYTLYRGRGWETNFKNKAQNRCKIMMNLLIQSSKMGWCMARWN